MSRRGKGGKRGLGRGEALAHRLRRPLAAAYNVVRPAVNAAFAAAGLWFTADFLSKYEWHHLMFAWAISLGIGLYGLYGLYRDVKNRAVFARWATMEDPTAAFALLDAVKKAVRQLPPWYQRRYVARKREVEDAAHATTPARRGRPPP